MLQSFAVILIKNGFYCSIIYCQVTVYSPTYMVNAITLLIIVKENGEISFKYSIEKQNIAA